MKKYLSGLVTGIIIMVAVVVSAAAVKQYILTPSTAKIVYNGVTQTISGQPIMEYNKNTYIPVKMLDRIGVTYKLQGKNYLFGKAPAPVQKPQAKKPAEEYKVVIAGKELVLYTDFYPLLEKNGYVATLVNSDEIKISNGNISVIITKDVNHHYGNKGYIDYDFFVEKIYPLL